MCASSISFTITTVYYIAGNDPLSDNYDWETIIQYLFDYIDTKKEGKIGGREAVMFFKKSGLPVENLKKIW